MGICDARPGRCGGPAGSSTVPLQQRCEPYSSELVLALMDHYLCRPSHCEKAKFAAALEQLV